MSIALERAAAAMALALVPAALSAKTVYVDCGLADYAGHDGSTPALAVKTIQEGIDKADSGDVVSVAAGIYREGVSAATSGQSAYRVRIDKPLTLRGAGRDVTHIVGEFANTSTNIGPGAVGGIRITNAAATGTRIEGFTIRDCGDSKKSGGGNGSGTAIHSAKTQISKTQPLVMSDRPWVVDCAISNIYASVGAVDYVNVARTTFERCVGHSFASVADYCDLIYCTVANQRQDANNHTFRGNRTDAAYGNRIVNCTVYGATKSVYAMSASGPYYLQNSILEYGGVFSREVDSCVLASARGGVGSSASPVTPASTNETATSVFGVADGVIAGGLEKDFRPIEATTLLVGSTATEVAASPALWLGNTNNLSAFPEEFRWKDVYGNPVVPNAEGRIHAGAVQVTMTPVAGFVVSKSWCTYLKVNGETTLQGVDRTIYTDEFPVLYRLDLPKDTEMEAWGVTVPFFGLYTQNDGVQNRYVFPDSTGQIPFVPAKGHLMTITLHQGTHVYYVDAAKEDGNADTGSGTKADPYARIQKAIDAMPNESGNRAVIFVAPGTYDKDLTKPSKPHPNCRLRFRSSVAQYRLVGTGGAENTIIPGAADTSEWAEGGCLSTNAIRCVHVDNAISVVLQGFTLTGGHTAKGGEPRDNGTVVNWGNSYGRGGAFWAGNSPNGWLIECIVTNNVAYYGGAAFANGNAVKCYFADNRLVREGSVFDVQDSGGIWRLSSCVVNETDTGNGDVFLQSNGKGYAVNCTILGDAEKTQFFNSNSLSFFMNCILVHGKPQSAETGFRRLQGTYVWDFKYTGGKGNSYTKADPQFADEANGDYRLLPSSPALGGGNAWTACNDPATSWDRDLAYKGYYRFLTCDMEGDLPIFRNGNPSAGAYQAVSDKIALTTSVSKSGAVSVSPSGRTVVPAGEPFTVTAADGARQVVGLKVNGEFRPSVKSVTFTPSELGTDEVFVEAVANTNWYVDAVNGSDANTGWTEDAACLTLTGVLARAESGDVVTALPGVYDQGSAVHTNQVYFYDEITDTIRLPSRAIVPAKVTLVSRDGAAATTIKGAFGSNADGTGEGAIRCVFLNKGAILRGFTLTGGSTLRGSGDYKKEFFDNVAGGAVLSAETPSVPNQAGASPRTTGFAEDCIITDNAAFDSAVCYGSYVHCLFTGNRCAAIREAHYLYGCVIGGNSGCNQAAYQPYFVDDCTFLGNDTKADGSAAASVYVYPNSVKWIVRNSLFLGQKPSTVKYAFNCRAKYANGLHANDTNNCWEDVSYDETLAVDDEYRPVRTCAAVDAWADGNTAGTNLFTFATPAAFVRDTDFAGGARVYNGRQDIGAGEHDWRTRYREVLGGSGRHRVTAASSGVVEEDLGVALADGETLTSAYRSRTAGTGVCEWTVEVEGEGTLTVSVNGGAAQAVTGTFSPELTEGENTFVFAFMGTGKAVLKRFRSYVGGHVILR